MSGGRHGVMVDSSGIRCLVSSEALCCMNCEVIRIIAGKLSAREKHCMIMDGVSGMKKAIYG